MTIETTIRLAEIGRVIRSGGVLYVAVPDATTLTDDHVPVDQLLARLFIERGNR